MATKFKWPTSCWIYGIAPGGFFVDLDWLQMCTKFQNCRWNTERGLLCWKVLGGAIELHPPHPCAYWHIDGFRAGLLSNMWSLEFIGQIISELWQLPVSWRRIEARLATTTTPFDENSLYSQHCFIKVLRLVWPNLMNLLWKLHHGVKYVFPVASRGRCDVSWILPCRFKY